MSIAFPFYRQKKGRTKLSGLESIIGSRIYYFLTSVNVPLYPSTFTWVFTYTT